MSLKVIGSNQVFHLVDRLAEDLAQDPPDWHDEAFVVVEGIGQGEMARRGLVTKMGLCAGVRFPLLRVAMNRICEAVLQSKPLTFPKIVDYDPWCRQGITFALMEALLDLTRDPRFQKLRYYLRSDDLNVLIGDQARPLGDRKLMRLAMEMTRLFQNASIYRPGLLEEWSQGKNMGPSDAEGHQTTLNSELQRLQPILWRMLNDLIQGTNPAKRFEEAIACLQRGQHQLGIDRIAFFAISNLSPLYASLIQALSRTIDTHLYLWLPSQEYWGDLSMKTLKEQRRLDDAHVNGLLAGLGQEARNFQNVRMEQLSDGDEDEAFIEPKGFGLLAHLQRSVLHCETRAIPYESEDDSVQFLSCYGDLRQVEALRDSLYRLFSKDQTLQPRDVLVLTPDLDTFGPLCQSVFSQPMTLSDGRKLNSMPFRVIGRRMAAQNQIAETLIRLFLLASDRVKASDVLQLLTLEPVQQKFHIDPEQLSKIREWVEASGARFGIDAAHREQLQAGSRDEFTWKFGLQRMALGLLMESPQGGAGFCHRMPLNGPQVDRPLALHFLAFCDQLFFVLSNLQTPRRWHDWAEFLLGKQDAEAEEGDSNEKGVLARLCEVTSKTREQLTDVYDLLMPLYAEPGDLLIDKGAVWAWLEERFGHAPSYRIASQAMLISDFQSLRGVSRRVIALLGMDEGRFPRKDRAVHFDLMAAYPKVGDPSPRSEDRFSFLQAILSAGDHLIVIYSGHHIVDRSVLFPAQPVRMLFSEIDRALQCDETDEPHQKLIQEQRLHAFSTGHFLESDPQRQSFDAQMLKGAKALLQSKRQPQKKLFQNPLPPYLSDEQRHLGANGLSVPLLVDALCHPQRRLLSDRLGIELLSSKEGAPIADEDRSKLNKLEEWTVGQDLVQQIWQEAERESEEERRSQAVREEPEQIDLFGMMDAGGFNEADEKDKAEAGQLQEGKRAKNIDRAYERNLGSGRVPAGMPGKVIVRDLYDCAEQICLRGRAHVTQALCDLKKLNLQKELGPWRLYDEIDRVSCRQLNETLSREERSWARFHASDLDDEVSDSAVRVDYGSLRGKRLLRPWIQLLIWTAQSGGLRRKMNVVVGRLLSDRFGDFEDIEIAVPGETVEDRYRFAMQALEDLLQVYEAAMQRPVMLFEGASFAYAQALFLGKPDPLKEAEKQFSDTTFGLAESQLPEMELCFGKLEGLKSENGLGGQDESEFKDLAEKVWLPLLQAMRSGGTN